MSECISRQQHHQKCKLTDQTPFVLKTTRYRSNQQFNTVTDPKLNVSEHESKSLFTVLLRDQSRCLFERHLHMIESPNSCRWYHNTVFLNHPQNLIFKIIVIPTLQSLMTVCCTRINKAWMALDLFVHWTAIAMRCKIRKQLLNLNRVQMFTTLPNKPTNFAFK